MLPWFCDIHEQDQFRGKWQWWLFVQKNRLVIRRSVFSWKGCLHGNPFVHDVLGTKACLCKSLLRKVFCFAWNKKPFVKGLWVQNQVACEKGCLYKRIPGVHWLPFSWYIYIYISNYPPQNFMQHFCATLKLIETSAWLPLTIEGFQPSNFAPLQQCGPACSEDLVQCLATIGRTNFCRSQWKQREANKTNQEVCWMMSKALFWGGKFLLM